MKLEFRTLNADEIELRVGSVSAKGATLLLYKDARCDQAVLDETVGALNWQRRHSRDNANCTVDIWDENKGIWVSKEDTGTESFTEKEKGLASDSFKRACTNWGIGRELYTAPRIFISVATQKKQNGKGYELSDPYAFSGAVVSDIDYDDKRRIKALSIVDDNGEIIFSFPKRNRKQVAKQTVSKKAAQKSNPSKDVISTEQSAYIKDMLENLNVDVAVFLGYVADKSGVPCASVDGMTYSQYDIAVDAINKKIAKMEKEM